MSDLKFSCPSCGQHIQCDESYAGENLPCPGCAHLIRVPNDATAVPVTPAAAANPFGGYGQSVPTLEENFLAESGTPPATNPPLTEREQQIAAARATQAAHAAQTVKPRLSFILSGGAAPIREENESALSNVEQKDSANRSPEAKALHE